MKILFDNLLEDGTLTSLNAEEAYPVSNLISPFLRQIYQASAANDTITLEFDSDQIVDSIFWGFTNARRMRVNLYDSADVLLEAVYLAGEKVGHYYGYDDDYVYGYAADEYYGYYDRESDTYYDPGSYHWQTMYTTVRKIVIELECDETKLYMGSIAIGKSVAMPNPDEQFSEGWLDNSVVSRSQAGQVLRDYVIPLRIYSFQFSTTNREKMNELRDVYIENGIGAKVWLDSTERNHDFVAPLFGVIEEWTADEKSGKQYRFSITITEAR